MLSLLIQFLDSLGHVKPISHVGIWQSSIKKLLLFVLLLICFLFFFKLRISWHFQCGCLKEHCHGHFSVFWPKGLKYLTRHLFSNIKLLVEHREYHNNRFLLGRTNYDQFFGNFSRIHSKKTWKNWPFSSSFNPFQSWPSSARDNKYVLVSLQGRVIFNKTEPLFNVSVDTDMIFGYSTWN